LTLQHIRIIGKMATPKEKIIYDFGSNNGDDIPYYLLKADRVIAVEANPFLVKGIEDRFSTEIAEGRLFVENCVLTVDESSQSTPFYLHKKHHFLSTIVRHEEYFQDYEEVLLPSINAIELLYFYGEPWYIKIDLEGFDHILLEYLLINDIRPPYLSAESHFAEIFCLLVAVGRSSSFKLVDGASVSTRYLNHLIETLNGTLNYCFPSHSAGPFGNDISGSWMTTDNFFSVLSFAGLGWKDIHVSSIDKPDPQNAP
jgi:hypothetical protein